MKASPLIEFSARRPAFSMGPELLMVMIGVLSIGLMVGAVTATAGAALLAGATGAVLYTTVTDAGADCSDHGADFLVLEHLVEAGLLHIDEFASNGENGLEFPVTPLFG